MDPDWQLSKSYTFDGQGIRCCSVLPNNDLVCGTQGGRLYLIQPDAEDFRLLPYQHNHSVTAMLSNDSVYITGCKDAVVRVFDVNTHELLHELQGHEKAVTSLSWCNGDYLITGSWDGSAKVWLPGENKLIATLPGHENTVSVCGLPSSSAGSNQLQIATGSAGIAQNGTIRDHSIRLWFVDPATNQVTMTTKVSNDHEGPIRALSLLSENNLLASCSNDGTVKLRDIATGTAITTLTSSKAGMPMLLDVTSIHAGGMAAAGEDGHAILWNSVSEAADPQVIPHPASVWTVTPIPSNGDLITCCQDGYLRVFTQATERAAPETLRKQFDESVAAVQQKQGPTPDEVAKLPKWELNALQQGKSEGQIQLFQKDGTAIAAQWSAASRTWIEVGQVMGTAGGDEIDGVKYDHVLPIEIEKTGGGVAKLQIGYNTGENPFTAAQRFIDAHMLPQHYLQQIADYIQQRAGRNQPTIGMNTASSTNGGGGGGGGGASQLPHFEYLPNKAYKTFGISKTTNFDKVIEKLVEVGKLDGTEVSHLKSLTAVLSNTSFYHSSKLPPEAVPVLTKILTEFTPDQAFPALDLLRYVALHPDCISWKSEWPNLLLLAKGLCEAGSEGVAVPMLTLRFYANSFVHISSCIQLEHALQLTERYATSSSKNVRLSVATLWMNVATCLHLTPSAPDVTASLIPQLHAVWTAPAKLYESEATTRMLWALGTCLVARTSTAKDIVSSLGMWSRVEMVASPHGDVAKKLAKEIYRVQNPNMGF